MLWYYEQVCQFMAKTANFLYLNPIFRCFMGWRWTLHPIHPCFLALRCCILTRSVYAEKWHRLWRIQNIRYSSVWSRITSSIPRSSLCGVRFTKSLPFPYVALIGSGFAVLSNVKTVSSLEEAALAQTKAEKYVSIPLLWLIQKEKS